MFAIIEMNPYETGEVLAVHGPFASQQEADQARKKIKQLGGHPDSDWTVVPLSDVKDLFASLEAGEDDSGSYTPRG